MANALINKDMYVEYEPGHWTFFKNGDIHPTGPNTFVPLAFFATSIANGSMTSTASAVTTAFTSPSLVTQHTQVSTKQQKVYYP